MKKILVILGLVILFNSCDDGDIKLESFNFSSQSITRCNPSTNKTFLYKVNDKEMLLLNIDAASYINAVTTINQPRIYTIGINSAVFYRIYSADIPSGFICSSIAPANPVVSNEWNATGGTIEVTTIARFDTDGTTIIGYTHSFVFKNISFSNATNTFSFPEYFFGDFQTLN
jgi:hypothetical protein